MFSALYSALRSFFISVLAFFQFLPVYFGSAPPRGDFFEGYALWREDYQYGEYYAKKCAQFSAENTDAQRGALVLLGDSLTDGWGIWSESGAPYPQFNGLPVYNRGISADTTKGVLHRLRQSVLELRPSALIVLIGINDSWAVPWDTRQTLSNQEEILRQTRSALPDCKIVVQSLWPLGESFPMTRDELVARNSDVLAVNAQLRLVCADYGCIYADTAAVLTGADGFLCADYTEDGLHPNGAGYVAIRPVLEQALES